MRVVLASVVWLAACYNEAAVTPCTLTCDDQTPCPGDLECGSDHFCQTPGLGLCSTTSVGAGMYIKATIARTGDRFGAAVALSADGNTLAVGAPMETYGAFQHAGAVYIYVWDGSQYTNQKRLVSPDPDDDDGFGTSVSLSADGNVLAVGVPGEDSGAGGINGNSADNTAPDSGAVFQFVRSPSWMQQRYIKSATATNWNFGTAVSLTASGMGLAVTAPGAGDTMQRVTRVTLGTGTTTAISASPMMAEVDDRVGASVVILDDASGVFVGASLDDENATGFTNAAPAPTNGAQDSGAMWGLGYSASYRFNFKAANTEAGDQFGTSVTCSSDGTTALAGAPLEDSDGKQADNSKDASGAVYVFNDATTPSAHQVEYLKAPTPAAGDHFGASISVSADGSRLVSGAPGRAGGGAAFVFDGDGKTMWNPGAKLVGINTEPGDEFGAAVAVSRNRFVIAVGAPGEASEITVANAPGDPKNNNAPGAGAVYVFR